MSGQDLENSFAVDGHVAASPEQEPVAALRGVSPGYTTAMGIPLRSGRAFTPADDERGAPVALVNEDIGPALVRRPNPIEPPISVGGPEGPWRTVVGVVADVRHRALATEAHPEVLVPWLQLDSGFLTAWARGISFVVRSRLEDAAAATFDRIAAAAGGREHAGRRAAAGSALVEQSIAEPRFRTFLLSSFALTSVCLAAVGIFGVLSYSFSEHTREIGIRMALGARPRTIFRDVLVQGAWLVAAGSALRPRGWGRALAMDSRTAVPGRVRRIR